MNDTSDVSVSSPQRRRSFSLKEKADYLERFLQSGLTVAEFCRQTHLGSSCLLRWLKLLEPPAPVPPIAKETLPVFQEVTLPKSPVATQWSVELSRPSGSVLRLAQPLSPQLLEQLLRLC